MTQLIGNDIVELITKLSVSGRLVYMEEQQKNEEVRRVTVRLILGWAFGVIFLIAGVVSLFSDTLPATFLILAGIMALPPFHSFIEQKFKIHISGVLQFIIIAVFLGLFAATMDTDEVYSPQRAGDDARPTATETSQGEAEQATGEDERQEAQGWVPVKEMTATANRQSDTFTLQGGQQRLSYTVTGGDFSICTVYVVEEGRDLMTDGGFPEVMVQGASEDDTLMRKRAGDYYLDVTVANGTCDITIEERR